MVQVYIFGGVIPVHQVYNKCTPPLHMGWAPHTVGPTPGEGVVYICCTLGVQLSLFIFLVCKLGLELFALTNNRDMCVCWTSVCLVLQFLPSRIGGFKIFIFRNSGIVGLTINDRKSLWCKCSLYNWFEGP